MSEKKEKIIPPRKPTDCRKVGSDSEHRNIGKIPRYYDALPRDCKYAYMTPGYYATGFRILDIYKDEVDFSEYRSLTFVVDPDQAKKWGHLKSRIPYPEGRITDLPGTRESHYHNYCVRSLTPASAMSWRKSIQKFEFGERNFNSEFREPDKENFELVDAKKSNEENTVTLLKNLKKKAVFDHPPLETPKVDNL